MVSVVSLKREGGERNNLLHTFILLEVANDNFWIVVSIIGAVIVGVLGCYIGISIYIMAKMSRR